MDSLNASLLRLAICKRPRAFEIALERAKCNRLRIEARVLELPVEAHGKPSVSWDTSEQLDTRNNVPALGQH